MLKKHLISGITGQDGLFLSSILLNTEKDVKILGISRSKDNNSFYKKLRILNNKINLDDIKIVNIDLGNKKEVHNLISEYEPDYVYNLSGPSSVYKSLNDRNETFNQIIEYFNNIINPIIENNINCNFFQASSSEMFDSSDSELDESSIFKPRSPYAEAKLKIHNYIQELKEIKEINISSGIMFNHESEFRDEDYLIMKIVNSAILISQDKLESLTVGSLSLVRDWSYAGDVAQAIYKINKQNDNEDYVIGSGEGNNIETLVNIVFSYFDIDWKNFVHEDKELLRSGDPSSIVANPTKLRNNLEWKTSVSVEEILIKCIEKKLSQKT